MSYRNSYQKEPFFSKDTTYITLPSWKKFIYISIHFGKKIYHLPAFNINHCNTLTLLNINFHSRTRRNYILSTQCICLPISDLGKLYHIELSPSWHSSVLHLKFIDIHNISHPLLCQFWSINIYPDDIIKPLYFRHFKAIFHFKAVGRCRSNDK